MRRFDFELRVLLAFAFVNGMADSALVPLLPSVRRDLGLSPVEVGMLLSTTTLAMLLVAMPIAFLASRFGTRNLLLIAALLMPASLVGQAFAGDLTAMFAARLLFGLSFGILWVIGPARAAAAGRGAAGTGPLIAAAGAGWLVGPVASGLIADSAGWRFSLATISVFTLPLVVVAMRAPAERPGASSLQSFRLRRALGLVLHNRTVAAAALVSCLLGVVNGVSALLVPLALAHKGLSAGEIGLAFGISAAVWIATATLVGRLRSSAVHFRAVGIVTLVLAVAWVLPALHFSTLALVAFLIVSAGCRSMINALAYAVGARVNDGEAAEIVISIMNLSWAFLALVTPLVAGLAHGSSEVRLAFGLTGAIALAVALVMFAPRPRATVEPNPS